MVVCTVHTVLTPQNECIHPREYPCFMSCINMREQWGVVYETYMGVFCCVDHLATVCVFIHTCVWVCPIRTRTRWPPAIQLTLSLPYAAFIIWCFTCCSRLPNKKACGERSRKKTDHTCWLHKSCVRRRDWFDDRRQWVALCLFVFFW